MAMETGGTRGEVMAARNALERKQEALVVWITADTTTYPGDERLDTPGELLPRLQDKLGDRSALDRVVVVNADARLSYASVAPILDLCREAGAEQIALATQRKVGI